jgi:hypothetical protein
MIRLPRDHRRIVTSIVFAWQVLAVTALPLARCCCDRPAAMVHTSSADHATMDDASAMPGCSMHDRSSEDAVAPAVRHDDSAAPDQDRTEAGVCWRATGSADMTMLFDHVALLPTPSGRHLLLEDVGLVRERAPSTMSLAPVPFLPPPRA